VTENTGVSEDQGTSNIKIAFAVVLVSRYDKKDKKRLNINIDENVWITKYVNMHLFFQCKIISVADPGSGAFFTPGFGSGMRKIQIQDPE
jgi:hypothetical protein